MKFGLSILFADFGVPPDRVATVMEDAGFDSLWVGDHTHIPTSLESTKKQWWTITDNYWHNLDMFVALTMAATVTTKLRVGTGLCLLVQRDPITVAKEAATLDFVSGGRLNFGIGAGWNAEEMANHGTEFSTRWRLLRERAEVVRKIWTEEEPEHHGEFESFDPIWSYPKPAQRPHPPIVVGGNGKKSLELAAALEAEWLPMFPAADWPEIKERHEGLRRAVAEAGGDGSRNRLIPFLLDEPGPELVEEMAELGIEQIVLSVWQGRDHDEFLRVIDHRARKYLS